MKILRKKDDFKKMPDKSIEDVLKINSLIKDGWNYCPKKVYKDFYKVEEKPIEEKPKKEKVLKKKTEK